MRVFVLFIKLVVFAVIIGTPLLSIWVASSLAAYLDGPRALAITAGLLAFPILPFAWEAWATRRKMRRNPDSKRWLSTTDRTILRTLIVNLAFLSLVGWLFPVPAFTALNVRGDWFLDDVKSSFADEVRPYLFASAESLESIYRFFDPNPFRVKNSEKVKADKTGDLGKGDDACVPGKVGCVPSWPLAKTLHPLVANMPSDVDTSIQKVGKYLAQEKNPYFRVKAIHDYVADRIRYDGVALRTMELPPYDAPTVFKTRNAVCSGYSQLAIALGKITGDKIVYVTGKTREPDGDLAGNAHAWNGVQIDGRWYVMDITWDAGHLDGDDFVKNYRSTYFLTPGEVIGLNHFPDEPTFQLRDSPITRGDFLRQPILTPGFFADGLVIKRPARAQVEVSSNVDFVFDNPKKRSLILAIYPSDAPGDAKELARCTASPGVYRCALPEDGRYDIRIYSGDKKTAKHAYVGKVEVVRR